MTLAEVRLWGRTIGAVSVAGAQGYASFQYDPEFAESGIELAPLVMPLSRRVYTFPELPQQTFQGLPGMLADALPDRFGNALIDAWLATQGRATTSFDAVERLCYVGSRGMGALEFAPALGRRPKKSTKLEVGALVDLASRILSERGQLQGGLHAAARQRTLDDILQVGTSAGGARAKAVIAWNSRTGEVRSGQLPAGEGFDYWLLKFDGVRGNQDKELEDPKGYGAVEYAYHLMARAAGIVMSDCRLLEENGRRHFMTRRFDRLAGGAKLHQQSLGALGHFDFNQPGAHGYEQALQVTRRLGLTVEAAEQLFRRMLFNVVARNQDDHVKNIAFLMDQQGTWSLAPTFDVTYSYNPNGAFTATHQLTINGKRDAFQLADFRACAKTAGLKRGRDAALLEEVVSAVQRWPEFAALAKVPDAWQRQIGTSHRLVFGA